MRSTDSLILRQPEMVSTADADCYGHLRPGALVNFMLQSAVKSADELGFGLAYLREHDLFWVLSRLSVEVYEEINWQDELEVITWPRDIDRLFYLRDFVVERRNGQKLAAATSAWLAIDANSKRPVTLDAEHSEIFTRMSGVSSGIQNLPKIQIPEEEPSFTESVSPVYSDFDLNGHVTTTRYIDWAMNTFTFEHHKTNFLRTLQVNFLKEVLPNEKLTLHRFDSEEGYHFQGIMNGSKPAYLLKAVFTSK